MKSNLFELILLISAQILDIVVKRLLTKKTKSNCVTITNTERKSDKINETIKLYLFIFVFGNFYN